MNILSLLPAWNRYSKIRCGIRGCALASLHNNEVEAEFCHCGSDVDGHGCYDNHSPVPMIYPPTPHSWERDASNHSITYIRSAA